MCVKKGCVYIPSFLFNSSIEHFWKIFNVQYSMLNTQLSKVLFVSVE